MWNELGQDALDHNSVKFVRIAEIMGGNAEIREPLMNVILS